MTGDVFSFMTFHVNCGRPLDFHNVRWGLVGDGLSINESDLYLPELRVHPETKGRPQPHDGWKNEAENGVHDERRDETRNTGDRLTVDSDRTGPENAGDSAQQDER